MGDHRLAHGADGAAERVDDLVAAHAPAVVVGPEGGDDLVGVRELVALAVPAGVEADAERGEVGLALLRQQADDEARVQAAREQHAHRDVGHHAPPHGRAQRLAHRGGPVLRRHPRVLRAAAVAGGPVARAAPAPVGLDDQDGGRRELAHAVRTVCGAGTTPCQLKKWCSATGSRLVSIPPPASERGQRGREAQRPVGLGEVERLDPEPVAHERDAPGVALGDREGEHAREAVDAGLAPAVPGLRDDLRVARREEAQAVGLELAAQLAVVVDAAVEGDDEPEVGVHQRLGRPVAEVDDLQPPVGQRDAVQRPCPAAVGPAARDGVGHPVDGFDVRGPRGRHLAREAAHQVSATEARCRRGTPRQASTKARKTAWCSGRPVRHSTCHWTPSAKARSAASTASTVPSGAQATASSPAPQVARGLMVEGVDVGPRRPEHARQAAARAARRRGASSPSPRRSGGARARPDGVGQVLVQGAPARDVQQLRAAAHAEDRHRARIGRARERELGGVQRGLDRAERGVRLRAVERRVDVRAAGQADAVHAVQQRLDRVRAQRRHDHGQAARALEGLEVTHPEGHLAARRVRLGGGDVDGRAAHLGRRDRDERPVGGVHAPMLPRSPDAEHGPSSKARPPAFDRWENPAGPTARRRLLVAPRAHDGRERDDEVAERGHLRRDQREQDHDINARFGAVARSRRSTSSSSTSGRSSSRRRATAPHSSLRDRLSSRTLSRNRRRRDARGRAA